MIAILPFEKPFITHVPYDNCVLSILQNYSKTFDWIYTNFVNIYINQRTGREYFYPVYIWKTCPFLDEYSLPYRFIKDSFLLYTDYLEYCLYNGYYVYNVLNIKYITKYNVIIDDVHNSFIYGIDSSKRVVKICDFFKNGIYESHDCSYDEINKAFSNIPDCAWYGADDFLNEYTKIVMLKFNDKRDCKFSYNTFRQNVINYLNMQDLTYNNFEYIGEPDSIRGDTYLWGADCWNYIKGNYTLRYFSLLVAYSKMWKYRYHYFIERKYIIGCAEIQRLIEELNDIASKTLYLYMKMSMTKKEERISSLQSSIYRLIDKCQETDFMICSYFVGHS